MRLLFLTLLMIFLLGQTKANSLPIDSSQRCIVHLNKSFFVSGEVIWYKIYFPTQFAERNLAIKVGIWDQDGEMRRAVFHKTQGVTSVQGYYHIPFELASGMYHFLVLGTDRISKRPVSLAQALIPVYNDLERTIPPVVLNNQEAMIGNTPFPSTSLQVKVELLTESIERRGPIKAKIHVRDKQGNPIAASLSVSVTDYLLTTSSIPSYSSITEGKLLEPNICMSLDSSISYSGVVTDSLQQPLQAQLLGVYSSNEQVFYYTKSDRAGFFSINLPDFYDSKPIQFLDYQFEDIQVLLQTEVSLEKRGELVYTPEVLTYLNASRQRKKIYQLYNRFEYELASEISDFEARAFEPDNSFLVQNYERFTSIPVFFKEVVTPLKFRKDETGRFFAKMFNPAYDSRDYYPGKPIFIVNGKLTRDADFVAKMDITQIEQIDLFYNYENLRQRFNVLGVNGVVVIKTDQRPLRIPPAEEADIFLINGLQSKGLFPGLQVEGKELAQQEPFLQPQLYWNPELQTNKTGELMLNFIQSDDLSTFRIKVVAQGPGGTWGVGQVDYKVTR